MRADRVLALTLLAASALYLGVLVPEVGRQQAAMGSGDFYTVGPTALPIFAGTLVAVFALAVLATTPRTPAEVRFTQGLGGAAIFAGIVIATAYLMPRIGFLPVSVGFLAVVFLVFRAASWRICAVLTLALPVLLDQVLRKVFLIPLPGAAIF
jgi:hypothetical protein